MCCLFISCIKLIGHVNNQYLINILSSPTARAWEPGGGGHGKLCKSAPSRPKKWPFMGVVMCPFSDQPLIFKILHNSLISLKLIDQIFRIFRNGQACSYRPKLYIFMSMGPKHRKFKYSSKRQNGENAGIIKLEPCSYLSPVSHNVKTSFYSLGDPNFASFKTDLYRKIRCKTFKRG